MWLYLRTAAQRGKYRAASINDPVDVPDGEAEGLLNQEIAVRVPAEKIPATIPEKEEVPPESAEESTTPDADEDANADPDAGGEKDAGDGEEDGDPDDKSDADEDEGKDESGDDEDEAEPLPEWTLKTDPAQYVKQYADGKNFELAKRHVAAAEAKAKAEAEVEAGDEA